MFHSIGTLVPIKESKKTFSYYTTSNFLRAIVEKYRKYVRAFVGSDIV